MWTKKKKRESETNVYVYKTILMMVVTTKDEKEEYKKNTFCQQMWAHTMIQKLFRACANFVSKILWFNKTVKLNCLADLINVSCQLFFAFLHGPSPCKQLGK